MIILGLYWLLVVGCAGESIAEGVQGDGWRAFGLALSCLLLLALHGELRQA